MRYQKRTVSILENETREVENQLIRLRTFLWKNYPLVLQEYDNYRLLQIIKGGESNENTEQQTE